MLAQLLLYFVYHIPVQELEVGVKWTEDCHSVGDIVDHHANKPFLAIVSSGYYGANNLETFDQGMVWSSFYLKKFLCFIN